jgi:E3 ubiquitin-protein ligase HUWE1
MIKAKPALFTQELEGFIKYMPNLLDFENKRTYFKKEITKMKRGNDMYGGQLQLYIRRDDILHDAFTQIRDKTANDLKGRLHISFTGERGQDAGGLTRDFFIELSREMFNPNYSLFNLSSSGATYYPNPKSYVEVQHLSYFKFIGRMIAKAIFDECLLECYFVKCFYKIMLGESLTLADVEDFDKDFHDNMKWCLENDVECLMTTFVAVTDYFGKPQEIELIEGGRQIPVTNENKRDYVQKLAYFKMYKEIQKQVDNFLEGFYEIIPKDLISIFNYKELELLISGLPNFDCKTIIIIILIIIISLVNDLK